MRPSSPDRQCRARAIADQPDPLAVRMVRSLLETLTKKPCAGVHLTALVSLCRTDDPSARLSLPNGLTARRVYDQLELTAIPPNLPCEPTPVPLPGQLSVNDGVLTLSQTVYSDQKQRPDRFFLCCEKTRAGLTLRGRKTGDILARPGRQSRALKKLMIDEKLPRHLRDSVPILDCGGRVAGVIGLGPDKNFIPLPGQPCWQIEFIKTTPKGTDEHGT